MKIEIDESARHSQFGEPDCAGGAGEMTKFYHHTESGPEELVLTPRATDEQVEAAVDAVEELCRKSPDGDATVPEIVRAALAAAQDVAPGFTAGIEAMRAALVEYFRVWPRDRMVADFISKFDAPRSPAAPAESARCSECGMPSPWHESKCSHTPWAGIKTPTGIPPLSASEPADERNRKRRAASIEAEGRIMRPSPVRAPGTITEAQATDMIAEGLKRPHPPAGVIEWPDAYAFDHRRAEPSEEDVAVLIATLRSQLETDRTIARAVLALLQRGKE